MWVGVQHVMFAHTEGRCEAMGKRSADSMAAFPKGRHSLKAKVNLSISGNKGFISTSVATFSDLMQH